jgi:LPLT family lysophospholipid transporter-like MFS transporter
MKSPNYPLLLVSQFLGAFGDNAILAVILGPVMHAAVAGTISTQEQSTANIFYTSLLFVPYLACAPLAGYFNDRFPKTHGLIAGNALKMLGALLAALSVIHNQFWLTLGYTVVGVGACVYSPAKYGILPEILPAERLVKANGTVEFLTLMAILCGNIGGAVMADRLPQGSSFAIVMGIYALSTGLNLLMRRTPAYLDVRLGASFNEFWHTVRYLFSRPRLLKILLGTSLFWICGAMMKMNFQPWGQQVLHLQKMVDVSLLGLWLSIGVMAGSVLAGQFHKLGELHWTRRYGLMLAAAIAAIASTKYMIQSGLQHPRPVVISLLIIAGVFAGLFLIPLNAALQSEAHQGKLGKTIATQNLLENTAMLCGSAFAYINVTIGFDPTQLFLALAGLVVVVASALGFPKHRPAQIVVPEPSVAEHA